jgi:peptide deformylase
MPIEELIRSGTIRPIVRWGDPVMHTPTRAVEDYGQSLQTLIANMFATNLAADGAGLAAPQVGVDLAVFVFDCFDALAEAHRSCVQSDRHLRRTNTATFRRARRRLSLTPRRVRVSGAS